MTQHVTQHVTNLLPHLPAAGARSSPQAWLQFRSEQPAHNKSLTTPQFKAQSNTTCNTACNTSPAAPASCWHLQQSSGAAPTLQRAGCPQTVPDLPHFKHKMTQHVTHLLPHLPAAGARSSPQAWLQLCSEQAARKQSLVPDHPSIQSTK
jgi:recombinational DNA repair protein RecR